MSNPFDIKKGTEKLLNKLDLVTRQEFDIQTQVLLKTRQKLEQLEKQLEQIEQIEQKSK